MYHFYCVCSMYHLSAGFNYFRSRFCGTLAECRKHLRECDYYDFDFGVYRIDCSCGCVLSVTDMTFPRRKKKR